MKENLYKNTALSLAIISAIIMGALFVYLLEPKKVFTVYDLFPIDNFYTYFGCCNFIAIPCGIVLILIRALKRRKQRPPKKNFWYKSFRFLYIFFALFNLYICVAWLLCYLLKIQLFEIDLLFLFFSLPIALIMLIDIFIYSKSK